MRIQALTLLDLTGGARAAPSSAKDKETNDPTHFSSTINVRTLPRPTAPPHRPSRHV